MSDSYTEVTHQSWLSRIGNAFKGILFGLLLFIAAFPLLFWNEGRAISTEKSLKEGAAAVISIDANSVDPANNGSLVYLSGQATTEEILQDDVFHIKTRAISLARNVEVYQWQEHTESKTEKELGGSTKTTKTYSYSKGWSSTITNSSSFRHPEGHQNPARKPYNDHTIYAGKVTLGNFSLNQTQIHGIDNPQPYVLTEENIPAHSGAVISQGELYIGTPDSPQVGDARIYFSEIKPTEVSIIAAQQADTFTPYTTSNGRSIQLINTGIVTAKEMFDNELANNTMLTWGLRLLGFVIMGIGLSMILSPLSVLGDVVPFIGNLLEIGTGIISGIVAFALSLTTIAIAWIIYRPLLAAGLIALVIGSLVYLKKRVKKQKLKHETIEHNSSAAATPGTPPPPPPA